MIPVSLIAYDVFDDHRRGYLRHLMGGAVPLQQSLWVTTGRVPIDRLVSHLALALDAPDRLHVHQPCSRCRRSMLGWPELPWPLHGPANVV